MKNMILAIFWQRDYTLVIAGVSFPAGVCLRLLDAGRQPPQHGQSLVGVWADFYGDSFVAMLFTWGTREAEQTGRGVCVPHGVCQC